MFFDALLRFFERTSYLVRHIVHISILLMPLLEISNERTDDAQHRRGRRSKFWNALEAGSTPRILRDVWFVWGSKKRSLELEIEFGGCALTARDEMT